MGILKTDAVGSFIGSLQIPADLTLGAHMLQVDGVSADLKVRSVTLGVIAEFKKSESTSPILVQPKSHSVSNAIPFNKAKYDIKAKQLRIIRALHLPSKGSITVVGYASATSGEDDIRISLDRALSVKSEILKLFPKLAVDAFGAGTSKNLSCRASNNQCAVVRINK